MNKFNINYRFIFFCLVLHLLTSFPNLIYGQDRESSVYKSLYTNSGFLYYSGYVIEKFYDTKIINRVRHNSYTVDIITGEGTYYYTSPVGSYRKGNFLNGELHGKGMRFFDGEYTEGNWSFGKRNGIARVWTEENYKYGAFTFEGNYVNDVMEGFGKYDCADYTYEGEFHNGQRHGKGKYIWKKSKGEYYTGNWVNGQRTGYGEMYWPDGSYYKGEFLNNNRHGDGESYNKIKGINQKGKFQNNVFIEEVESNISSSNITSQNKSNQNESNQAEIETKANTKNVNIQCNYKITIPVIQWKFIDNRQLCKYCRARYSVCSKVNLEEMKKINVVRTITTRLEKHLRDIDADEVHKDRDRERLTTFMMKNNFGDIVSASNMYLSSLIDNVLSFFPGSTQSNFNEIKLYDIKSEFCSLKCRDDYQRYR